MNETARYAGAERRRHHRYHLPAGLRAGPLLTARAGDSSKMPVINWSYGGMLLVIPGSWAGLALPGAGALATAPITMELHLSEHHSMSAMIQKIAASGETFSCAFVHDTPDALLFMRPWMECLRLGNSLVGLKPAAMKPEMVAEGWFVWRGDGPVTLFAKSGGMPEWRLVFPDQGAYAEVGASAGRVWQRKVVNPEERISPRMAEGGTTDHRLVDSAVMILAGACGSGVQNEVAVAMIDALVAVRD